MTEYTRVVIGKLPDEHDDNYEVQALPEDNRDFRDGKEYDRFTACWLKVNDIGFATSGAEFSEHEETIVLEQDTDGGSMNIVLPDQDD